MIQDYLLPTIAYYGGAAEIAYFAQTGEVYRLLERPITPILPRSSLTMIERHTGRVLERYGLGIADLFAGPESVLKRVVEEHLGAETAKSFTRTEATFKSELDELREQLRSVDPTLADALETGRRKINYQLEGLRTRFHRAQMARDEATQTPRWSGAFDHFYRIRNCGRHLKHLMAGAPRPFRCRWSQPNQYRFERAQVVLESKLWSALRCHALVGATVATTVHLGLL